MEVGAQRAGAVTQRSNVLEDPNLVGRAKKGFWSTYSGLQNPKLGPLDRIGL